MRQNWCDKTDATCDKIALCKRAYLCDMRLLHAVAGKLKSSNFLATIACRNKPVYIVRFWRMSHGRMFLSHRVNAPLICPLSPEHDLCLCRWKNFILNIVRIILRPLKCSQNTSRFFFLYMWKMLFNVRNKHCDRTRLLNDKYFVIFAVISFQRLWKSKGSPHPVFLRLPQV